jgi:GT2 family glycosyltransferase
VEFSSVIAALPVWKNGEAAVGALSALTPAFEQGLRAVIADNGSGPEELEQLRAGLREASIEQHVTIVEIPENRGFCAGANAAVEAALVAQPGPAFVWVINPDTAATIDDLRELLAVAAESRAAVVSAPEGGRGFAGQGRWPRPFYLRPDDFLLPAPPGARWTAIGRCACWCSLFDARLVRELIDRDGHFLDESLFLDWDEWDVSLRAVSLGHQVVAALRCTASHHSSLAHGASAMAPARQYYRSRNALVVARRHVPAWTFWVTLPVHLARDATYLLRLRIAGKRPHELAYLEGVLDAARGQTGRWRKHPSAPSANP